MISTFTQFVTSFVPSKAAIEMAEKPYMLAINASVIDTCMDASFTRKPPVVWEQKEEWYEYAAEREMDAYYENLENDDCDDPKLLCPACLEVYRNCKCGVLPVCPDCGDFLDYGCQCNEAQEEFEAEMCESDPDLCRDCGEYECDCTSQGWSRGPRYTRRTRAW